MAIIAAGSFYALGESVADLLHKQEGITPTLINPRYLTGIDEAMLDGLKKNHRLVVTLEDGVLDGGFGEKIARYYGPCDMKVSNLRRAQRVCRPLRRIGAAGRQPPHRSSNRRRHCVAAASGVNRFS